jgi:4'-phosphopantetheinyl transferase
VTCLYLLSASLHTLRGSGDILWSRPVPNSWDKSESIHWLIQKQSEVPGNDRWLSLAERDHLAALRFPKRRNDWLLGRWTAKTLLSGTLGIPHTDFSSLEIISAPDGAPQVWLLGEPAAAVLSISHSEGVAFCAATAKNAALGCDIETITSKEPLFLRDYFTMEEQEICARVPERDRSLAAILIWSAKESALKAMREGLRRDTRSVVVHIDPERRLDSWNPLKVRCLQTESVFEGCWRVQQQRVLTLVSKPAGAGLVQIVP